MKRILTLAAIAFTYGAISAESAATIWIMAWLTFSCAGTAVALALVARK